MANFPDQVSQAIKVVDTGTNDPRDSYGSPDVAARDYLQVTVNGSTREVTLQAKNDGEDAEDVSLSVAGVFMPPRYATGDLPTLAAGQEGAIAYDTTTNDLMVWTGAAWVVVGTQS